MGSHSSGFIQIRMQAHRNEMSWGFRTRPSDLPSSMNNDLNRASQRCLYACDADFPISLQGVTVPHREQGARHMDA